MANAKSKELDRRKFLADPVLVMAILLIMAFLLLFIVYPLWTVTSQSFSRGEGDMIAAVKASGEWFTKQAGLVEDGSAQEFADLSSRPGAWQRLLDAPRFTRQRIDKADHTFSRRPWQDQVSSWTRDWLRSW